MTSTPELNPSEYRRNAQECWERVDGAADVETKALFQLTAEAWEKLAAQVETLQKH